MHGEPLGNINQILTVVTSGKGDHGHCIQTIKLSGRRGDKGAAATGDLWASFWSIWITPENKNWGPYLSLKSTWLADVWQVYLTPLNLSVSHLIGWWWGEEVRASQVALLVKKTKQTNKKTTCQCRRRKRHGFNPWVKKIPWRKAWQPTPVFLPGESQGQGSLVAAVYGVIQSWTRLKWLSNSSRF